MKSNRSLKKKEAGVSAVIGVILMVAITVAIAAVVYVYVEDIVELDTHYGSVSGNITSKFITGESTLYYHFVLDDKQDVSVSESDYYKYAVGDFYKGENK
jgi:FlaG/FlaF family flagellin (archaellin)